MVDTHSPIQPDSRPGPRGARSSRTGNAGLGATLLFAAVTAYLAVFLLWPLLGSVSGALYIDAPGEAETGKIVSFHFVQALLENDAQREAVLNSLFIAVGTTALTLLIALPLAWLFARRRFPGKSVIAGLLLLPMILPPFVGAVGMKAVFSRVGPLSLIAMRLGLAEGPVDWLGAHPFAGIMVLEALHLFPILYLNLLAAFANIDPQLEEAARNCGASPGRVFWRVTLPLAGPGLFAGVVLVFIWSFTELGTPLVFGLREVLPVRIFDSVGEIGTNPVGYAQVLLLLVVTALGFYVSKRLTARTRDVATLGRQSVSAEEQPLSAAGLVAAYALLGFVILLAVLPHISVICMAVGRRWFLTVLPEGLTGEYFARALGMEMARDALVNSLVLALSATVLDVALGFGIAWLCVRSRAKGSGWLDALSMLPLAVPGIVIAFGYMGCFGWLHAQALGLSGDEPKLLTRLTAALNPRVYPMLVLAASYSIRRLPFMVRAAHAGLEQVSPRYEEAAASLGASPLSTVRRITLPLVGANLLAGGILCFSFSMLEVSDSLILAQSREYYPITKAIYAMMGSVENGLNLASALGVWAMALLAAGLLWAAAILGKRVGQMFRAG